MSKTKEELNNLKEEVETVSTKLQELTEEELAQVNGGHGHDLSNWRDLGAPGNGFVLSKPHDDIY